MMVPVIHSNGTSEDELISQLTEADKALGVAIQKVRDAWPNARDYYPISYSAVYAAEAEWRARLQKLEEVKFDINVIRAAIWDR